MFNYSVFRKIYSPKVRQVKFKNVKRFNCSQANCPKVPPLRCKVIILTGAGGATGQEITKVLIENGARAVIMADRSEKGVPFMKELNKQFGENKALFQKCDCSIKREFQHLFECTMNRFSRVDIVINYAGIWNDCVWESIIRANAYTMINGTDLGIHYMGKHNCHRGGIIANLIHVDALAPRFVFPVASGVQNFQLGYTKAKGHESQYNKSGVKVMGLITGLTLTPAISNIRELVDSRDIRHIGDLAPEIVKFGSEPAQSTEDVAISVVKLLKEGETGEIYIIEDGKYCPVKYDLEYLTHKQ